MSDPAGTTITVGTRTVCFLDRGPRDGIPVMYLHGMPGCRLEQRLFPDSAVDRVGIRLISIDRPGWGRTDPIEGDRIARSTDVLAVASHLGINRFALMAVSTGGSYALALAAHAPECVDRVVLVSAQMPYDDEPAIATLQPDQLALLPAMRLGRIPAVVDGCEQYRRELLDDPIKRFWPSFDSLSAPEREFVDLPWVRDALVAEIIEGLHASSEGLLDDLLAWPQGLEVDVRSVRCPVVAIHGSDDDWEPLPNLQRILRDIEHSDVLVLQGRNHLGPLLHPVAVLGLCVPSASS